MSDQGKQYVYNGVLLRCDKGVLPTPFTVLPRPSRIRGQFQAHELDKVPLVNIKPFGVCAVTHAPCMPAPLLWTGVHQGALRLGPLHAHPLLESSTCQCSIGGTISILMPPAVGASGPAAPAPTAAERGDATAHGIADKAKLAALGFAVLGVGLAIAGCFFPPLELAAAASFETALAASASAAFVAADVGMALGAGIDVGVALAHPTPANKAVVVGDALGLAIGCGAGKLVGAAVSKFGPTVAEMFAQRAAAKALQDALEGTVIKSPKTDFGKLRLAYEYYKRAGWSKAKIIDHMQGIDPTKPIELVEFPANKVAGQLQSNPAWKGNYFAEPGTPATNLGINPRGELSGGTVVNKTETLYSTTERTTVLRSSAAPVVDTWSVPSAPFQTEGGAPQYFHFDKDIFQPKK